MQSLALVLSIFSALPTMHHARQHHLRFVSVARIKTSRPSAASVPIALSIHSSRSCQLSKPLLLGDKSKNIKYNYKVQNPPPKNPKGYRSEHHAPDTIAPTGADTHHPFRFSRSRHLQSYSLFKPKFCTDPPHPTTGSPAFPVSTTPPAPPR